MVKTRGMWSKAIIGAAAVYAAAAFSATAASASAPAVSTVTAAAQSAASASNPCWSGAVCLWEDVNYRGAHRTYWDPGLFTLADRGFKNMTSSICNNTSGGAVLQGYALGPDDQLFIGAGECVADLTRWTAISGHSWNDHSFRLYVFNN
jgi:hypothetical protein